jgi:hypothetical protein
MTIRVELLRFLTLKKPAFASGGTKFANFYLVRPLAFSTGSQAVAVIGRVVMQKKYIIVVSVVVVLWCAFMVYRHHKKKQDTGTYKQKASNQITEIAKKSPRAGLVLIGRAIKRYYKENNAYPSSLQELCPKYLANKAVIEELELHYEPTGDDFFLSTTFTLGNRRIVAHLDKGLRPQTQTGVMVATPTAIPKAKEVKRPDELAEASEPSAQSRLALAGEKFLKTLRQRQMDVTSVSLLERDEARIISTVQPEIVLIGELEIESGVEFELSHRYLVWKDKSGVLGFSNLQYPDADRLSICAVGRWYNVKIPLPKGQETIYTEAETPRTKKVPGMIAESFDRRHLVWKDKHGTLGFGNLQYPEGDNVSVLQTDGWISIERPPLVTETGPGEDHGPQEAAKLREKIASDLSTRCLVWKDKHGTLGFGNVQYPERGDTSHIHVNGSWEPVAN